MASMNLPPTCTVANGSRDSDVAAAAIAAAKREKRAVAASMAPRMQSQVQKWAKMTAELGGAGSGSGGPDAAGDGRGDGSEAAEASAGGRSRPRKKAKTGHATDRKKKAAATAALPFAKQPRAPHRHDRYVSFGIGAGIGRALPALPPTCLLCLARFESRQQLRDHEALSSRHRRRLRDAATRRAALQRYAKLAEDRDVAATAAEAAASDAERPQPSSTAVASPPIAAKSNTRPPSHTKRLPRRRGDLAPTYTSYAVPVPANGSTYDSPPSPSSSPEYSHACLLCRRRFHGRAMLRLHERESTLHRARTRDPAAVAAAVAAVNMAAEAAVAARKDAKAGDKKGGEDGEDGEHSHHRASAPPLVRSLLRMRPAAHGARSASATTQYRDRARERRLAFGSTGVFGKGRKKGGSGGTGGGTGGGTTATTKDAAAAAASTPASKGAALLSKMGWTAGQGLGVQGSGMAEALAPTAYRSGVGLGAQGGKLGDAASVAERRTENTYAGFVEQTQETARQRYLALDRAEAEAAAAAAAAVAEEEDGVAAEPADES